MLSLKGFSKTIQRLFNDLKSSMKTPKGLIILAVIIILILVPYIAPSYTHVLSLTFPFVIMVVSWDLLAGYNGQLNLGHSLFIGLGGYTAGLLFLQERFSVYGATSWIPKILPELPIPITVIMGGIFAAIIGVLVGILCLRLKGYYLALVTLMLPTVFIQLTGILSGLLGSSEGIKLPFGISLHSSQNGEYFILLGVMIVSLMIMLASLRSRWGLILQSIRDNENLARSVGINTLKYKLSAFAMSAFFAGIAGGLMIYFNGYIGHSIVSLNLVLLIVLAAVLGGTGTFYGPIIGAFLINLLRLEYLPQLGRGLPFEIQSLTILFGLLVVLILLFPHGIYSKIQDLAGEIEL